MTDTTAISPTYFQWIAKVATDYLGGDHFVAQLCQEARASGDPASVDRAMTGIRQLPPVQRDHILATAKVRMREEADVLNFLSRGQGPHPSETKH